MQAGVPNAWAAVHVACIVGWGDAREGYIGLEVDRAGIGHLGLHLVGAPVVAPEDGGDSVKVRPSILIYGNNSGISLVLVM